MTVGYDDNEGSQEMAASQAQFDQGMAQAGQDFGNAIGEDASVADRLHSVGDMFQHEAGAVQDYGNGFSEEVEDFFDGGGSLGGELLEAGSAIGSEVVEAASEAGMAVVGGTWNAMGEIATGLGDGAEHAGQAWDDLTDGNVSQAGQHAVAAVTDVATSVVDAVGLELEGAGRMVGELVEGAGAIGAEIGEGVSEVGSAISDAAGDAWDSLFGSDDEPEAAEESEDEYAG